MFLPLAAGECDPVIAAGCFVTAIGSIVAARWIKQVLITGEKLSESTASDVRELCNTLLNCYLIQLLETGFLHADP